jgi:hypothetical protein
MAKDEQITEREPCMAQNEVSHLYKDNSVSRSEPAMLFHIGS